MDENEFVQFEGTTIVDTITTELQEILLSRASFKRTLVFYLPRLRVRRVIRISNPDEKYAWLRNGNA